MNVIPLAIYLSELALMAIILYFVVAMIPMGVMVKVCQVLIILIAIFAAIGAVLAGQPAAQYHFPSLGPAPPSIIAPERR